MRYLITAAVSLAALTIAPLASAEVGPGGGRKEGAAFLGGVKGGASLSFGGLSPFVTAGIEVGVVAPWLHRSFAFAVDLDYTVPKKSGTESDPRIMPGGKYSWHLTQQELNVMPVIMYRLTSLGIVTPFIGVGPRLYFLESTVRSGEGTPTFQETTEQSMKVGFGVPLGVEVQVGPGGFLAELLVHYGPLDHTATGASNTGGTNIAVGYRFLIP